MVWFNDYQLYKGNWSNNNHDGVGKLIFVKNDTVGKILKVKFYGFWN